MLLERLSFSESDLQNVVEDTTLIALRQKEKNIDGLIVTSIYLPETLLQNNKQSLREAVRGLFFVSKIL